MQKIIHWITLACLTTLLAACGGGGGGGGGAASNAVASTDTFQVRTAWVNYYTDAGTHPLTVSGTSSGHAYSGTGSTITSGPTYGTQFYSQCQGSLCYFASTSVNATIAVAGQTTSISGSGTLYADSNYNPVGSSNSSEYVLVQGSASIPATGKVGDSGVLYTANRYSVSGPSGSQLIGTQTMSYALLADTATTALLRVTIVNKNLSAATDSTETLTFRINPAGALTWLTDNTVNATTTVNITFL